MHQQGLISHAVVVVYNFSRHALATLHFNENLQRKPQTSKDEKVYFKVSYPKYKLGEEVVRHISLTPTYGKQAVF